MSNSRSKCHFARPVFIATLALFAGGCAEVSFKRGGSAADFDADKLACSREIADSDQTLAACMERRGWFLHQFEGESAAAEEVVEAGAPAGEARTDAAAETEQGKRAAKKKKAPRPLAPAAIGTWFKFGAGPDALGQDQASCVAELGEAHWIQSTSQPVSPEMRACMKQKGWFGIESAH